MQAEVQTTEPPAGFGGAAKQAVAAAAPRLLYAVFVLSGAAGLIYESIWSRYLGLFLGHGAYAQVLVLSMFLGGMSGGALIASRHSHRLARPLLWYAAIEFAAGAIGLIFHPLYTTVTAFALETIFPALAGSPSLLTVVKWSIGAALILPQSLLLGATFPLMSAGVVRHLPQQPGRTIASLYFANSIGAAGGVLIAGFWLLPMVGLPGTVLTAGLCNIVVAVISYYVARALPAEAAVAPASRLQASTRVRGLPLSRRGLAVLLLTVTFGTAVASFIYEITWIRMLSLVLGSATHSFELMLSAFILGLALGALAVRSRVDREETPLRTLAEVQWAMGALALFTLPVYVASFAWTSQLLQTFTRSPSGYTGFNLARYALCLAVMLPPTFFAGMTLPLITKSLLSAGFGERAVGWVYSVNTLGSIVGVALAGLVLLPVLGLKALLVVGAALDMALGVALFAFAGESRAADRRRALWYSVATVAVTIAVASATTLDKALLASGVFRFGMVPGAGMREVLFHRDGRTATVAVFRTLASGDVTVATNGKADASLARSWLEEPAADAPRVALAGDNATQLLLALTTLAHNPAARTAAVVGFGSGISTHFLLGSASLEGVTTIEIEPAMIEASRSFYPANRRAYDDPRSRLVIEDAKTFFAASPQPFDVILSEPSNPWVSGVSSLFGLEFYDVVARHLAEGGVFGQWLQLYEIDDGLVLSIVAAVHQRFGDYQVFVVGSHDILIVATKGARLPPPDWSVFASPMVQRDLARFLPFTPAMLEASRFLNRAALAPLLDQGTPANSDFFPILDAGAEEARFLGGSAQGFLALSNERFSLTERLAQKRPLAAEMTAPVFDEPLMQQRARAARLRQALRSDFATPRDATESYQLWQWSNSIAANRPPADWRTWVAETIAAEADLHGGSAGSVDEEFYTRVHRYMTSHAAPSEAVTAIGFIEALARWDHARAARLADGLLDDARNGNSWVPARVLLDGGVFAKVLQGDLVGAQQLRDGLARYGGRSRGDLRQLLLEAYIARSDTVLEGMRVASPE